MEVWCVTTLHNVCVTVAWPQLTCHITTRARYINRHIIAKCQFATFREYTPCPQKNLEVCFLAIYQLLLGQIQKVRFWKLQVLRISKLSLLLIFGQVEAEIFEVKDTRGHFQFSHNYARFFPVLAVTTTLLVFQNSIWHLAILLTQITQLLTKKKLTQKNDLKLHKNVKTENDPWCL